MNLEKKLTTGEIGEYIKYIVIITFGIIATYTNARKVPFIESRLDSHEVRISVHDSKLDGIQNSLNRIENKLDRIKR